MLDSRRGDPVKEGLDRAPELDPGYRFSIAWGTVVQSAPVKEPAAGVVEKKVRCADRAKSPGDFLGLVIQERKRKSFRHFAKFRRGILGVGLRIVGANRHGLQSARGKIRRNFYQLPAHVDDIGAVSADKCHQKAGGFRE